MKSPCRKCDPKKNRAECADTCDEIKLYQKALAVNGTSFDLVTGCYICHADCDGDYCDRCRSELAINNNHATKHNQRPPVTRKDAVYPRTYYAVWKTHKTYECEYCHNPIEPGQIRLTRQSGTTPHHAHDNCARGDNSRPITIKQYIHNDGDRTLRTIYCNQIAIEVGAPKAEKRAATQSRTYSRIIPRKSRRCEYCGKLIAKKSTLNRKGSVCYWAHESCAKAAADTMRIIIRDHGVVMWDSAKTLEEAA